MEQPQNKTVIPDLLVVLVALGPSLYGSHCLGCGRFVMRGRGSLYQISGTRIKFLLCAKRADRLKEAGQS